MIILVVVGYRLDDEEQAGLYSRHSLLLTQTSIRRAAGICPWVLKLAVQLHLQPHQDMISGRAYTRKNVVLLLNVPSLIRQLFEDQIHSQEHVAEQNPQVKQLASRG
jgi:hypothetical protein